MAKISDKFSTVQGFKLGYRRREDFTTLPPGVLIQGSQNVLTNTSGRIAVRKGYTLDGQSNTTVNANIQSAFDWQTSKGYERNLRGGFLSSASSGKLQYRYVASAGDYYNGTTFTAGQVYWIDLITGQTNVSYNFANYVDTTEKLKKVLLANGATATVTEWSGGITTFLSATVNTITKKGTTTWAQEGFTTTGTRKVTINGTDYGYTGGETTTTLTGVTADASAQPVNSVIHQTPKVSSAITDLPADFTIDLISSLYNQVYYGCFTNPTIYISKINDYTTVHQSAIRTVGEGASNVLEDTPVAFIPQQDTMYISAGKSQWYQAKFTQNGDFSAETFTCPRLKTTELQGAQSQAFVTKIKNYVAFLSFEPIINSLGLVENVLSYPQVTDLSNSIVDDMNEYDFTGGSNFYFRNFLYTAVPEEGIVRVYNMTDPEHIYWEAPLILPISRFYVVNGELYGHSSQVGESYKLFTGYNDNGNPIAATAMFSYQNDGIRTESKSFDEFYVEGYISLNTTLTLGLAFDLDGCATNTSYNIVGTDTQIVCINNQGNNSLGKFSLGKQPLGGQISQSSDTDLPPKFRVIKTFPPVPYYEYSPSFSSTGIDQQWEILAFAGQAAQTTEGNNPIKQ